MENKGGPETKDTEVNMPDAINYTEDKSRLTDNLSSNVNYDKLGARPKVLSTYTQNAPMGVEKIATSFSQLKSRFDKASESRPEVTSIDVSSQDIKSLECNVGEAGEQSDSNPRLQLTGRGTRIGRLRRIFEASSPASPLRKSHGLKSTEILCLESSTGKRKRAEIEEVFRVGKRTKGPTSNFSLQGAGQSERKWN